MAAPERARPQLSTFGQNHFLEGALQSVSDNGADFAWDMCRAEAIKATEGLTKANRPGAPLFERREGLAAWNKWVRESS